MAVARPIPVTTKPRPAELAPPAPPLHFVAQSVPVERFRRCTFRRVEATQSSRSLTMYKVDCMYPDRVTPLPLGDLATAHPVCSACTNPGIFRADSD